MKAFHGLSELLWEIRNADLRAVARLLGSLPAFLREPVGFKEAHAVVRGLLDRREETFLGLVRTGIFDNPASPYLPLLRWAGCDFSDLRARVRSHGVEETLQELAAEGVYFTAEEFKGKTPVRRGTTCFRVEPRAFETARADAGYVTQSSGTTNAPLRTVTPLAWLGTRALSTALFLSAHGLMHHRHAIYDCILPGSAGMNQCLTYAKAKVVPERWFARPLPVTFFESAYFRLVTRLVSLVGSFSGQGFPRLVHLSGEDFDQVLEWMAAHLHNGDACCVTTPASNAARLARRALARGTSLEGATFITSGEPLTGAKHDVISRAGARVTTRCTYGGSIVVGFGCANPHEIDEVHVNQHSLSLISHRRKLGSDGLEVNPLLLTTLHSTAPRLLLNVESGDYGTLMRRDCGCALQRAGLTLHLQHIRSFEKLTSEGMNYYFADLVECIEKTLPERFGGGPGDYQLVEEEAANGQTHVTLVVRPDVRQLDETELMGCLLESLTQGPPGNRVMARLWLDRGTLRVKRALPHSSPRGKILPLHIERKSQP